MIFLAIDIGNTDTVLGIFREDILIGEWRLSTVPPKKVKVLAAHMKMFCRELRLKPEAVTGAGIASVVPKATPAAVSALRQIFKIVPMVISGSLPLGIRINYDRPASLGADRLCNIVAAREYYGGPAIVVDLGSAITYDVISKRGDYLGGVIAPGFGTSAKSLYYLTAQLPMPPLMFPRRVIGQNTISCLQSGVMFGTLDSIEGTVKRITREARLKFRVIATGGYAPTVIERSTLFHFYHPSLVLEGIRLIYRNVNTRHKR